MNELALYNENDDFAADWIENLIRAGHVAPGVVDRRSIVDLTPDDLLRYKQVHLFAGIAIWSASFRDAGIRDDEPWWSASCPCQPFSAAGQGNGFADERHLWPYAFHLIEQCKPAKIAGEQVASPDGLRWLDLVSTDMEAAGYAFGASDLCAAGIAVPAGETQIGQATVEWIRGAIQSCPDPFLAAELRDYAEWFSGQVGIGAPHIRQRLYWLAYASHELNDGTGNARPSGRIEFADGGAVGALADLPITRSFPGSHAGIHRGEEGAGSRHAKSERHSSACTMADAMYAGRPEGRSIAGDRSASCGSSSSLLGHADNTRSQGRIERRDGRDQRPAGPSGLAFWSDAEWIVCTDGQARPVEVGTFPLAHGERSRVGKLRAYGNQIVRPLAAQFILASQEAIGDMR